MLNTLWNWEKEREENLVAPEKPQPVLHAHIHLYTHKLNSYLGHLWRFICLMQMSSTHMDGTTHECKRQTVLQLVYSVQHCPLPMSVCLSVCECLCMYAHAQHSTRVKMREHSGSQSILFSYGGSQNSIWVIRLGSTPNYHATKLSF